jgi:O-antigen ligase
MQGPAASEQRALVWPTVRRPAIIRDISGALEQAQLWLVRLGAFALPLVVLWSTNDPVVLPKLLAARLLVLLITALVLIRWWRGELKIRRTPLDLPIVAYVASACVSTLFAANVNLAVFGEYGRLEGLTTIATYAALFWLTVQSLSNPAQARGVLRTLLAGAFVVSLLAILQAVAGALLGGPSSGVSRAAATFGNANVLAAYLAMALPLAVAEFMGATSTADRLLSVNVVAMLAIALVLTFGRGGWFGGAVGVVIVITTTKQSRRRVAVIAGAAAGLGAAIVLAIALLGAGGGVPIAQSAVARLLSLLDPTAGTGGIRLHLWKDTLSLIASRPLMGYGPDSFGLVFPTFQTGWWSRLSIIDESHSEILQITATQGILGLAAFAWLCIAFVRMWWRGRDQMLAMGILGACVGYVLTIAVNFSAVPAALPFWIFLGAAAVILPGDASSQTPSRPRRGRNTLLGTGLIAASSLAIIAVAVPYSADSRFHDGMTALLAGDQGRAATLIADARSLQPQQPLYAAAAGNAALAGAEWVKAREAYLTAARLGSFDPSVFRQLAIADQQLGLRAEAIAAAKRSVELNRFDRRNQAVLQAVTSEGPG